jgi:primosomal protein N' (replication factor Y)
MLIDVAVPVPALDRLTYRVADSLPVPEVGTRVVVPLGTRHVTGIVVGVEGAGADRREGPFRAIRGVLDAEPFIPSDVVALAQWTAEYYAAGIGETIMAVLPPTARGKRADAHKTARTATITPAGLAALASPGGDAERGPAAGRQLTANQRRALSTLASAAGGLMTADLTAQGVSAATLTRLARHGLVSLARQQVDRDPFTGLASDLASIASDRALTPEQIDSLARLTTMSAERAFRVAVLHGVTGSGKTEIYLRLAVAVRASGRAVLMLVPEIGLTSAVASLFRQTFGDRVAIQHSGLSDGERHDQWQRIRHHGVDVVVGTRSAVFAPLARLGLVIVDEEHDPSYKQEESPRYNGRDVAIVRAERAGALVVLGSATPSMESYFNAMRGRYERVVLERRILDRPLPSVSVVDMRQEYAVEGPDVVLSRPLRESVETRLARGEQALILLNRRGFATAVFCRQCAGTVDCPNCSVSLVVHGEKAGRRARCHYCNYSMRVPSTCPLCAAPYLEQTGFGTERVEAEVRRLYPEARVSRLDRDAARRKGAVGQLLARFLRGEIDVLVGTQMIAKGHDFPRVTLVGVVSADVGLGVADFRAAERTFQLIAQVAGRAGRGEQAGEAIVQTLYPEHYSIQLACRQDYAAFYERELAFRRAMRYPPLVSLVNVIVRGTTFSAALDGAEDIARRLRRSGSGTFTTLGPAPAPIGRLRGQYRAQLLVKGTNRRQMREAVVAAVRERAQLARRVVVDIDPLNVL